MAACKAGKNLVSLDFEIFGRVQGVFFRKYTQKQAKKLHLVGWVMNTRQDTVKGQLEGPTDAVQSMRHWLSKEGSPHSRIDKAEFGNETPITTCTFKSFSVRH